MVLVACVYLVYANFLERVRHLVGAIVVVLHVSEVLATRNSARSDQLDSKEACFAANNLEVAIRIFSLDGETGDYPGGSG